MSKYDLKLPQYAPPFVEFAKQMRINQEIVMKEISEHVDKEIERLKCAMTAIGQRMD